MAADGAAAAHAGWDGHRDGVVLVDVGGALDDAHLDEHAGHEAALVGGGDVAPGTWHLGGDLGFLALREGAGAGGINDGGVWASTVGGDDVDSSGEGSARGNLGQGGSRSCHDLGHVCEGVGASLGLPETVGGGLLGLEDSGVDLSLLVGSCAWDDATLDTETSGVSTGITSLEEMLAARS